MKRQDHRVQ